MKLNEIIEDVHRLVNIIREKQGREPIEFEDRSQMYGENFMAEFTQTEETKEAAPFCQCTDCLADTTKAKLVRRAPRGGGWSKYAFGHKPADGKVHTGTRNIALDGIPTESLFIVKVYTANEYRAKDKVVDDRILSLIKQVNRGEKDEITCLYPEKMYAKKILKQLQLAVETMKFNISIEKKKDHIAIIKQ